VQHSNVTVLLTKFNGYARLRWHHRFGAGPVVMKRIRHVVLHHVLEEGLVAFSCVVQRTKLLKGNIWQSVCIFLRHAVDVFLSSAQVKSNEILVKQKRSQYIKPVVILFLCAVAHGQCAVPSTPASLIHGDKEKL